MKFEYELRRQAKLYVEYLRETNGEFSAVLAEAVLNSFLNWYLAD